jgi:hypothetical protein
MSVQMGVDTDDQAGICGNAHDVSSLVGHAGKAAPAWWETPAAIL